MARRTWTAVALAGTVWLMNPAMTTVAGQQTAEGRRDPAHQVQRTADGRPDLHGVWSYATITPLERPVALGDKATFRTVEEAVAFQRSEQERRNQDRRDPGTPADVSRAYNDFWWDFGRDLAGMQTSLVVDPPDGRIPALTPEAEKRQAARTAARAARGTADDPEDRNLWERCITRALPTLPGPYNNNIQIFQTADHVVIVNEMIHEARIVPLDNRPRTGLQLWHGEPRGRWEGDTLVVETKNFTHKTNFRGAGANLRLTERYTRVDADTLRFEVTIEDPTTWTRPWTASIPMRQLDEPIFEYACHEANYGLGNILKGARAEDRLGVTNGTDR
jgi:hypothetical protein